MHMKTYGLKGLMAIGVILAMPAAAAPIYSDVDANGRRVFSDAKTTSSREVRLQEGTIVSGSALGKQVAYKYGAPDTGRRGRGQHPQVQERERRESECASMKDTMNSSAGRLKLNTEERYHRECILPGKW